MYTYLYPDFDLMKDGVFHNIHLHVNRLIYEFYIIGKGRVLLSTVIPRYYAKVHPQNTDIVAFKMLPE